MTDKLPKTFEQKLSRIDAIVKELEGGTSSCNGRPNSSKRAKCSRATAKGC